MPVVGDVLAAGQHHAPQAAHGGQAGQLLVGHPPACADVQVLQGWKPAGNGGAEFKAQQDSCRPGAPSPLQGSHCSRAAPGSSDCALWAGRPAGSSVDSLLHTDTLALQSQTPAHVREACTPTSCVYRSSDTTHAGERGGEASLSSKGVVPACGALDALGTVPCCSPEASTVTAS